MYQSTNESLPAIITGLAPTSEDTILAIGGSGDQAFALLEFAEEVRVVDKAPEQISLIRHRRAALEKGNYFEFFSVNKSGYVEHEKNANRREYYFKKESGRLEKIRQNLENLIVYEPEDIIEVAQLTEVYSKIYLSNAIGFSRMLPEKELQKVFNKVSINLPVNGLVYVTNHNEFMRPYLPPALTLDRELSLRARDHETNTSWNPAVYRKIAENKTK